MRAIWAAMLAVVLVACAREPIPTLALACQTTKCTCLPAKVSYPAKAEPVAVLWKQNGDAYCPPDYVLRRAEAD